MTAETPLLVIQTAIFELLDQDAQLGADVYDYVPEDAPHPYVVVGEAFETPDNTTTDFGRQSVVTLHIWTKARGHAQGLTIKNRVVELLDHEPLDLGDFHHVATRFEFGQALRDPDPEIRHVVARFRVVTEQERV